MVLGSVVWDLAVSNTNKCGDVFVLRPSRASDERDCFQRVQRYGRTKVLLGDPLLLVECLSRETGISPDELIKAFGQHLAARFSVLYPSFFDRVDDVFGFLASIENHVHVEVRKLYPDAELPSFRTEPIGDHAMKMIYESRHPFADLAEGLIIGCSMHFGESISIERIQDNDDTLRRTEFMLSKRV